MENNMVHPAAYMELMHDVRSWMKREGLDEKIETFLSDEGGISSLPRTGGGQEIYGWLKGETGWSIDPMTFSRFNNVRAMRDMIETGLKLKSQKDNLQEGIENNEYLRNLKKEEIIGKCKNIIS
jgi:hypothetical protein